MLYIAVINNSKRVSDDDVKTMIKAVQKQLTLHVAPAWNQRTAKVKFYTDLKRVPNYAWVVSILDTPDEADALGYHLDYRGQVQAMIFVNPILDNDGVILYDENNPQNVSVSSVLSHEIVEMFGDRYASFYADDYFTETSYALELCDPVESDSYAIDIDDTKVSVSNFVFPSWFNAEANKDFNMPFDYLKKLNSPFTMSAGGYVIIRKGGPGSEQLVFGDKMLEWKKYQKLSAFSRFYRRTV